MTEDPNEQASKADSDVEREIREGRKFNPQELMARLAGPGAMKGASPIPPVQQAETEIGTWLRDHVADSAGALPLLLNRQLKGSQLLVDNLDRPLVALARHCRRLLASDHLLQELVREADVEWGRSMDERPYFDREGMPPNPSDPYTVESVRRVLQEIVGQLADAAG